MRALDKDGRTEMDADTYTEDFLYDLARDPHEQTNLAAAPAYAAVRDQMRALLLRKMEEAGIIDGSRVVVGEKAMGFDVCCFVGIELVSTNRYTDVVERLRQMPEVVECHFITGQFAMLVKMYCRNNEHLMDVLVNNIQNIEGISRTETFISLDRAIERPVYVKDRGVLGR